MSESWLPICKSCGKSMKPTDEAGPVDHGIEYRCDCRDMGRDEMSRARLKEDCDEAAEAKQAGCKGGEP